MAVVTPLFQGASFDPDVTQAMAKAYEEACQQLNGAGTDRAKEAMAKRIIHLAQSGVHDPILLRDGAIEVSRDL